MKSLRTIVCVLAVLAVAGSAVAQMPTGTIAGRVTDAQGPLPGVTITVTSPNLQGDRMAVSTASGDYIFALLPPGQYTVVFEMPGFQTLEASVKVNAAQTAKLDAEMPLANLTEEITVTGTADNISTNSQVATTMDAGLIDELPVARNIEATAALTPGVSSTGPGGNLVISGALSYDNLFMVNGVVITDNVRGTPNNLFIEDAIQETTTQVGGVSAEYGRFAGGVVNTITKSGGNELHGSLRANLENDSWSALRPGEASAEDTINPIYEGTLGGYLMKDRLWFFTAVRTRDTDLTSQTDITDIPFSQTDSEQRYEGKLTFSFNANHRVVGSYMKIDREQTNNVFGRPILDLNMLDRSRTLPQELMALHYTGIVADNFFVEAQYSKRKFTFSGSGGDYTDLINGTTVRDNTHYWRWNAPVFCGVCDDETRDNEDILAKGSWFLSSDTMGSHDLTFGVDSFNDMRLSNNYQSGSNWIYWPTNLVINDDGSIPLDPNGSPYPIVYGDDGSSDFTYWAVLERSKGTNFRTNSAYINDTWRLNNNFSFNIGVRYDKNDGEDASHNKVADDSRFSPRLGVTYDPNGDGSLLFNASYGHYVTAIAGSVADQGGGSPSSFGYLYEGPDINTDPTQPLLTTHEVLQRVFDWLFLNGTDAWGRPIGRDIAYGRIAGLSQVVGDNLKSPYSEEISVGASKRIGTRGLVRMDYIHRDFKDLYETHVDMSTGQVTDELGNVSDLKIITNSDVLNRTYEGINLQAQYRTDRWNFGGNYTWSHLYGNYEGEGVSTGPYSNTSNPYYYPEYSQQRWTNPSGDLAADQRHRARAWFVWDAFSTQRQSLSLSVMQSYFSGTPYGASASIYVYPFVDNPGYAQRPVTATYYFTARDAYRTDDITRTDFSVNYSFKMAALGSDFEFYVQPEIINVFNEQGVTNVDTTVYTRYTDRNVTLFDPFTEEPVEGVNWVKGPDFGKPQTPTDYQQPRTFRISLGVRF